MEILIQATRVTRLRGLPALLVLTLAMLLAVPAHAPAQSQFSLAEIRQIQQLRDLRNSGQPSALAKAAQSYLNKFPEGRYADEALLALGESRARLKNFAESIAAYSSLIEHYPDSPFREQAMAGSIPLLTQGGEAARAGALAEKLLKRYPRSLYRDATLLWQARASFKAGEHAQALTRLEQIQPGGLKPAEQTEYHHMAGWAYRHTNQPEKSRRHFSAYAKREDSTERKAPVLMQLGAAFESEGKYAEAFALYSQLVGRHPHPDYLPEALYRRADTFQKSNLQSDLAKAGEAQRLEAIGHYDAYLQSADSRHERAALRQRALLLKSAGRREEALRDFQRLARLDKGPRVDRELLLEIATLLGELGRGKEAAALLSRAIENDALPRQERAVLILERAAIHYRAEDCKQVLAGLQTLPVFRETAHRQRALFLRGFCHYRLGHWEPASWDLEGVVKEADYVELVWAALMEAYEKSGQHSRMAHLGEQLLYTKRVEPSKDLLLRMAAAYEKVGQPNRMLSVIRRLEAVNPEAVQGVEMQLRLGAAEDALGNLEKSKAHYLAALESRDEKGGLSEVSLEALAQLQRVFLYKSEYRDLVELNTRFAKAAKGASQRDRIATLQAIAYLRWGQAESRASKTQAEADKSEGSDAKAKNSAAKAKNSAAKAKNRAEQAREKFDRAWAVIPARFSSQRLEILVALTDSYADTNKHEEATKLFAQELKRSKGRKNKARISEALGAFYLGWGAASEKRDPPAKVASRYGKALELLPAARWEERYRAVVRLDGLHRQSSNFDARAQLFDRFAPTVPDAAMQTQLRVYRAQIFRDWARFLLNKGNEKSALQVLARGEALLEAGEWRPRYELLALRGEFLIKRQRFSELLILYEKFLPAIEDSALRAQVNHFLGQIYLTWGQSANKARNVKSTRIRAWRALDYLPEADWKRRLAAVNLLNGALDKEKRSKEAAELIGALIPTIPDKDVRRRYAVFLGKKYLNQLNQPEAAEAWLLKGDLGKNDAVSLEAGYLKADLKMQKKDRKAAIDLLEELSTRDLSQSNWLVPIHSRLAVLYHEGNKLNEALQNYRIVASVKSREMLKLYPRPIDTAREQVRALSDYLRFQGGSGQQIAVPKVNQ